MWRPPLPTVYALWGAVAVEVFLKAVSLFDANASFVGKPLDDGTGCCETEVSRPDPVRVVIAIDVIVLSFWTKGDDIINDAYSGVLEDGPAREGCLQSMVSSIPLMHLAVASLSSASAYG